MCPSLWTSIFSQSQFSLIACGPLLGLELCKFPPSHFSMSLGAVLVQLISRKPHWWDFMSVTSLTFLVDENLTANFLFLWFIESSLFSNDSWAVNAGIMFPGKLSLAWETWCLSWGILQLCTLRITGNSKHNALDLWEIRVHTAYFCVEMQYQAVQDFNGFWGHLWVWR